MQIIGAGSTLYITDGAGPHLWLVLSDPVGGAVRGWVVTVMIVTHKKWSDDTVILQPGDHPFVRHESSVNYSTACERKVDLILRQMHRNRCELRETLDGEILARVQQGLLDSPRTVNAIRALCQNLFDL